MTTQSNNHFYIIIAFPFTYMDGMRVMKKVEKKEPVSLNDYELAKQRVFNKGKVISFFKEEHNIYQHLTENGKEIWSNGYYEYLCVERHTFRDVPYAINCEQKDIAWFKFINEKYEVVPKPEYLEGVLSFL